MLFSAACERNRVPLLAVLRRWLPPAARVLEVGSGSGQHAVFFTQQLEGLVWQPSERAEAMAPLAERISLEGSSQLAAGSGLHLPLVLDVTQPQDWPVGPYDAVFSANTAHIMDTGAVAAFLAGSSRVLGPGGLLLLYGPFCDGGVHTAASNAAFDAHLRELDPAMGVRDAEQLKHQAGNLGLESVADVAMPAENRTLIWRRRAGAP
ncbi:DUF938 domain-containing protein [Aphanothece stagnina]|uniref:DUF938 domain-containing protein n=1 Tax=Aphanothece stagnina TaxID=1004305 RepID=UPI00398F39B8